MIGVFVGKDRVVSYRDCGEEEVCSVDRKGLRR